MDFWEYQKIKLLIRSFKSRGFQIRFPGGTSLDGKINSVVLATRINSHNKIFFIVVPYDPASKLVNKILNKKENEKSLALRKLREETGMIASSDDLKLIGKIEIPNNLLKDGSMHTKYFFLLEKFEGKLIELENSSMLRRETSTPFFVPGVLLSQTIFNRHLLPLRYAINYVKHRIDEKEFNTIIREIDKRTTKK